MRFLTFNTLRCPAKDVAVGYPLRIEISNMEIVETECNIDFMRHIATSLNWESLLIAAQAVGMDGFPTSFSNELLADEDFLIALHRLILDIHITEGFLICPESGRRFRITNGIPSMMLPESEV